jgi:hypothetical protein
MIITTALILLLLSACWLLKASTPRRSRAVAARTRRPENRSGKYHAVSIKYSRSGCSSVKALKSKRFLTRGKVPTLPVANCTSETCTCGYIRHEDRRSTQGNRRAMFSMQSELYGVEGEKDRRAKRGRRASDWSDDAAGDISYGNVQWGN